MKTFLLRLQRHKPSKSKKTATLQEAEGRQERDRKTEEQKLEKVQKEVFEGRSHLAHQDRSHLAHKGFISEHSDLDPI